MIMLRNIIIQNFIKCLKCSTIYMFFLHVSFSFTHAVALGGERLRRHRKAIGVSSNFQVSSIILFRRKLINTYNQSKLNRLCI